MAHSPASQPSIEFAQVTRRFGERAVLDCVDLRWDGPAVVGLAGPNGSGKTSLLRLVAQLLEPDTGTITVCGQTIDGGNAALRRLVGFAPHEPLAYSARSARQNLVHAGRLAGLRRADAEAAAAGAISRWQLLAVADVPVATLSRGWAQRYSAARADLLEPAVLLLDEPTTGLDDRARAGLEGRLEACRGSRLVVVSSHERAWLDARCDLVHDLGAIAPVVDAPALAGSRTAAR